ncbi:MAG: valine--tRNA ligase [Chthoniobacteraceae bacterium]
MSDIALEIPKTYEPQSIEEKWYAEWLASGCFTADPASKKPAYSIVIPPPNVTGVLTLGHVLNNTIQDILARRARMLGKEVLWLPGTDHAGIATQNVVEKTLRKSGEIRHRDDLGREKLVEKIWEWKEKYGGIIIQQLKKLGASCDWSRERFTMDPEYSACVTRVFVDLYKKGLIYRGKRMVNWCPASLTAVSDEEVEMKPQNGTLYYFKVEVVERESAPTVGEGATFPGSKATGTWLTIATTRPETIPGDTAVAVNPKDPRYAHLIGKHVVRPLPVQIPQEQRLIPIIGDDHVDFEFGTGVLKVTPAHDKADYEIGLRHNLPIIDIMNPDATMNALAGESLVGLDRFEARKVATEHLRDLGVLEKEEPYQNNVGFSERGQVPIEPRLSDQWWLRYPQLKESLQIVQDGTIAFRPERWARVYQHWIDNNVDWCLSRQLWWGHRIPVWYRGDETFCGLEAPAGDGWNQDPDVLDTWFSAWLWPFATMGWPAKTDTLARFYPTTDLVTGPDIIFLWVARMIMAGLEWTGEMPFKNVYFTGIIRDKQGRKMSKSLGNSPDPLDLIAKFGADALRFGVMRSAPLGQDILFDEKNVELGRNFCTKLWNATRFRQMQGGEIEGEINPALLTSDDKWILLRLDAAISEVSLALDEYRFSDAAQSLYRFFWSEYCDWYLEASKASLATNREETENTEGTSQPASFLNPKAAANTLAVIDFILAHTLRLFHPFIPFITEELWHGLGYSNDLPDDQGGKTIMFSHWPKPFGDDFKAHYSLDETDEQFAAAKYEVVNHSRALRRDYNIASNKRVRFVFKPNAPLPTHESDVLKILLNASTLDVVKTYDAPKGTPVALTPLGELFLPLEGLIDVAAERERLKKEIAKVEDELAKVRAKLANPGFTEKVPPAVLEDHKQREATWADKLTQLQKMRDALEG